MVNTEPPQTATLTLASQRAQQPPRTRGLPHLGAAHCPCSPGLALQTAPSTPWTPHALPRPSFPVPACFEVSAY